eukprot:15381-Heterococcus_DN1.PRE.1
MIKYTCCSVLFARHTVLARHAWAQFPELQVITPLTVLALAAQAVEELPDVKLFGEGIGVVLLASLGAIALLICCIGRTTAKPW